MSLVPAKLELLWECVRGDEGNVGGTTAVLERRLDERAALAVGATSTYKRQL